MELLLIAALVFASVAFAAISLAPARAANLHGRLGAYQYTGALSERDAQLEQPLLTRLGGPLLRRLAGFAARLAPQRAYAEAQALMIRADWQMDLNLFMLLRAAGILALPVVYLLVLGMPSSTMAIGGLGLACWYGGRMPVNWLKGKADKRTKRIQRSLPDTLDLITVSVEAGLGLDAAIAKVVEKTRGPLRDEFGRVLQEVSLGQMRRVALREMAERCQVPDLNSLVGAILQADQMGLGIAEVLRTQSDEVRIRRRQRAEETAMKAPVKMLFPLIACIFPAMMSVLLGPAVWRIYTNIVNGGF